MKIFIENLRDEWTEIKMKSYQTTRNEFSNQFGINSCLNLTLKTPKQHPWTLLQYIIVDLEQVSFYK